MTKPSWLNNINFHPVIKLPENIYVHDFRNGEDLNPTEIPYSVGRYNECRENMYTSELFLKEERNIHMGVDIAAPIGEKIYSFSDGKIFLYKNNKIDGSYGPTIITEHTINSHKLYVLYGHLSLNSLDGKKEGQSINRGEIIGFVGDKNVNGGWFPHLHFQLSLKEPKEADLPGVVSKKNHKQALKDYPDPRWVLGPIY